MLIPASMQLSNGPAVKLGRREVALTWQEEQLMF